MRILFVNSYYFIPQSLGGLARTLDSAASGLRKRGHEVVALVQLKNNGDLYSFVRRIRLRLARNRSAGAVIADRHEGYKVLRCWNAEAVVRQVIETEQPDLVIICGGRAVTLVREIRSLNVPTVIELHDVEFRELGGNFADVIDMTCIANSQFTADVFNREFGAKCHVILPSIQLDTYKVESSRERVLFVHPIRKKGLLKAMEIVRLCPDIPFTFVGQSSYESESQAIGLPPANEISNLEILPNLSDMRIAYRKARVLLVPSQWEEAYGRVVNEAGISGIPAIVSRRGGLPEAMGGGGIDLPHDASGEEWAAAVRQLWSDDALYAALSEKARLSAGRIELTEEYQLDRREEIHNAVVQGAQ